MGERHRSELCHGNQDLSEDDIKKFLTQMRLSTGVVPSLKLNNCGLRENNIQIEALDLSGNRFDEQGIRYLVEYLESSISLRNLTMRSCCLDGACSALLADCIKRNRSMRTLDLSSNELTFKGVAVLSQALVENGGIDFLKLSHCDIVDGLHNGMKEIGKMISTSQSLCELHLDHTALDANDVAILACAILERKNNNHADLSCLHLSFNGFGIEGMMKFMSPFRTRLSPLPLERLDIRGCKLGKAGIAHLVSALFHCTALTELDIADNNISDEGCVHIAEFWGANPKLLRRLDLSENLISDPGARILGLAMQEGECRLETLILRNNYIHDMGGEYIAAIVVSQSTLEDVDLSYNPVRENTASDFIVALDAVILDQRPFVLRLCGTQLPEDILQQFSELQRHNPRLSLDYP